MLKINSTNQKITVCNIFYRYQTDATRLYEISATATFTHNYKLNFVFYFLFGKHKLNI